jgi:hypothetical protein
LDTIDDVLEELKLLLTATISHDPTAPSLNLESALNCVLTALITLNGPGRELEHEDSSFSTFLFELLPRIAVERSGEDSVMLAIQCMQAVLIKRRE